MTIDKALERVRKEYEKAKDLEFVRDPVAYALYAAWRAADNDGRGRKQ